LTNVEYAIEVDNLHKTYSEDVEALRGISFAVEKGKVFALLGPNGAGKSTTVKILTTLSKATDGTARVAGLDVTEQADKVRHAIGVVSQKSGAAVEATGRENLRMQAQLYGVPKAEREERIVELLGLFGLTEAADRIVKTYSGGMVRKLDVAIGLIQRPEVLFLDEPTTGLDPEARSEMWDEISRLASQEQLTIMLTTHYLDEADSLADTLAIVDRGKIVASGTPDELKAELKGDAVRAELAHAPAEGEIERILGGLEVVNEVQVDGATVLARSGNGAAAVPGVLSALDAAGIEVAAITVARPSLDDVYLQFAGRRFAEADSAEVAA
jgi:ABC-2 type transport system ATP-binding protein